MQHVRKYRLNVMLISAVLLLAGIGTAWGDAVYEATTGVLSISSVDIPGRGMFDATLNATDSSGHEFVLKSAKPASSGTAAASYDEATGMVYIPSLAWYGMSGTPQYSAVEMRLIPGSAPKRFQIVAVIGQSIGEGAIGPEGPTGPQGPKGDPGAAGSNGYSSLIKLTDLLPQDIHCPIFGGVMIQVGLDSNRDGVLQDPGEVIQTSYVCSGYPSTPL